MEEEVFFEDFLLLQIGVQGYLDCETKMISIQIKWSHKGFKFSYLLKKKED